MKDKSLVFGLWALDFGPSVLLKKPNAKAQDPKPKTLQPLLLGCRRTSRTRLPSLRIFRTTPGIAPSDHADSWDAESRETRWDK